MPVTVKAALETSTLRAAPVIGGTTKVSGVKSTGADGQATKPSIRKPAKIVLIAMLEGSNFI